MTKQQGNSRNQNQGQHQKSAGSRDTREPKGDISVREAGHKGGQRVRELIDEGKQQEGRGR